MLQEQMQLKLPPKPPNWREVHDVTTDLQILNLELQRKLYMDDSDSSTICTTESESSDVDTADTSNTTTSDAVSDFEVEQDEWLEMMKVNIQQQLFDLSCVAEEEQLTTCLRAHEVDETSMVYKPCNVPDCSCHDDDLDDEWYYDILDKQQRGLELLGEWFTFDRRRLFAFVADRGTLPPQVQVKLQKWANNYEEHSRPNHRPLPDNIDFYDSYDPVDWLSYYDKHRRTTLLDVLQCLVKCFELGAWWFDQYPP